VSSWTTKLSAEMRQNKGAGETLTKFSTQLGGLTPYMDVKDVTQPNKVGPPLVIEIQKPIDKAAKSPGVGRLARENKAPDKTLRALSKAEVYFERPTADDAVDWFKRTIGSATQG